MLTSYRYSALVLALVCLISLTGAAGSPAGAGPAVRLPQLILWAWERPESLRFADADHIGVAFLAESIYLERTPVLRPRMQPLRVGKSTPLMAVVRLETVAGTPAAFDASYLSTVAQWIARVAALPQVQAVQIDFDATRSQHDFYRSLLYQVRPLIPASTSLSITALGSWCMGDDWLGGLPIDDAVPMLFRMGVDRRNILTALARGQDFREPLCRNSVGLSTDEPWPDLPRGRRVYVFNPRPWTESAFQAVEQQLNP